MNRKWGIGICKVFKSSRLGGYVIVNSKINKTEKAQQISESSKARNVQQGGSQTLSILDFYRKSKSW